MKTKLSIGVLLAGALLCGLYVFLSRGATAPLQEGASTTAQQIAQLLGEKYNRPTERVLVEVATDTGAFAKGSVNFENEPGGGLWFAVKTDAGWKLAYDGNGIIPCNAVHTYDLPVAMVPQCIDTEHENALIDRVSNGAEHTDWSKKGALVMNAPGMKPDTWYLVYEEPGAPALSMELLFTTQGRCTGEGASSTSCIPEGTKSGTRAQVEGDMVSKNSLRVHRIELLP